MNFFVKNLHLLILFTTILPHVDAHRSAPANAENRRIVWRRMRRLTASKV